MGNTFGRAFRVTTFGESHGAGLGAIIDGCPAQTKIDLAAIAAQMDRRRPGQSHLTTQRQEADEVELLSGVADGVALGTPIGLLIRNADARPKDYATEAILRPSHADYTYRAKYGIAAASGGGRASARETAARVAAGAIAEAVLAPLGVQIVAWVSQVHTIGIEEPLDLLAISRGDVDRHLVRCPAPAAAAAMQAAIEAARKQGDSLGGVITAIARGVPAGWGEPVFEKLDAELARAMMSLPAVKGFEIGSGFAGTRLRGSEHNDEFYFDGKVRTKTNRSGGIQGGISNGECIEMRIAFKPTATIMQPQASITPGGDAATLAPKGRHDPCVLPRAVPIVEAMTALVLVDMMLRQRHQLHA
ncbi:MAG: chorismate synthase [Myxococcales bacterium]|nr:chorismate synthase [Myxococcales bacterium]